MSCSPWGCRRAMTKWPNNSNRCELGHRMHFLQLSHLIYNDFISASHIQTYINFMMDLIYSHSQSLSFQWPITRYMFIVENMKITDKYTDLSEEVCNKLCVCVCMCVCACVWWEKLAVISLFVILIYHGRPTESINCECCLSILSEVNYTIRHRHLITITEVQLKISLKLRRIKINTRSNKKWAFL